MYKHHHHIDFKETSQSNLSKSMLYFCLSLQDPYVCVCASDFSVIWLFFFSGFILIQQFVYSLHNFSFCLLLCSSLYFKWFFLRIIPTTAKTDEREKMTRKEKSFVCHQQKWMLEFIRFNNHHHHHCLMIFCGC